MGQPGDEHRRAKRPQRGPLVTLGIAIVGAGTSMVPPEGPPIAGSGIAARGSRCQGPSISPPPPHPSASATKAAQGAFSKRGIRGAPCHDESPDQPKKDY